MLRTGKSLGVISLNAASAGSVASMPLGPFHPCNCKILRQPGIGLEARPGRPAGIRNQAIARWYQSRA